MLKHKPITLGPCDILSRCVAPNINVSGPIKQRSAKVSNIPGDLTQEFADLVFCRGMPLKKGSTEEKMRLNENPSRKLQENDDFDG